MNPLFAYTHLMLSPLTLSQGQVVLGTSVAYGVVDSVQIETNVWNDIYQIYNGSVKVNVIDADEIAVAGYLSYQNFNYNSISSANPNLHVAEWQPGMVVGYQLLPDLAHFVGGNLNFTKTDILTEDVTTAGYLTGAQVESDLSWAYNRTRRGQIAGVISGGVTYDFSYKIVGFGVSHSWRNFKVGVHYYPNATQYRVEPILAAGMALEI